MGRTSGIYGCPRPSYLCPATPTFPQCTFWFFPRIPAFVRGFAVALLLMIALSAWIANQDIPADSALYPIKVTVQGLQVIPEKLN
jgi:hypothetical protein